LVSPSSFQSDILPRVLADSLWRQVAGFCRRHLCGDRGDMGKSAPLGAAQWRLNPVALSKLFLRFAIQSIVAGIDVARRALDPRMPLRPGFVNYPVRFPPGPSRNTFAALTSLLPGTVPAGYQNGQIVYHCLDINQSVISQLAAEEAALAQALGDD
jgi:multicomponent Na+:H+ antiporter subunit E